VRAIRHRKLLKRAGDRVTQESEIWISGRFGLRSGNIERIDGRFQGSLAVRAPAVIDMTLGKGGAQPPQQRTAARIRIQWRAPFSVHHAQAEKF
jgi:hypothetical protein